VALANEMINMVVDLLENAKKESTSDHFQKIIICEPLLKVPPLDICAQARSSERILRVFQTIPVLKVFYQLADISYQKVIIHFYLVFIIDVIITIKLSIKKETINTLYNFKKFFSCCM